MPYNVLVGLAAKNLVRKSPDAAFDSVKMGKLPTLDASSEAVKHSNQALSKMALNAFYSLGDVEEDDLDDDEGLGDRLKNLIIGIVASDNGDEVAISDEDSDQIDVCRAAIGEKLSKLGCDESDISDMLNDWDSDATERCVSDAIEDVGDDEDGEATMDSIESFVFGQMDCSEADEMIALDSATFDATYKKKLTIVGGKKKWAKKRVSGVVRLSPKQKTAIKKMLKRSHTADAKRKRAKSMKQRKRLGM